MTTFITIVGVLALVSASSLFIKGILFARSEENRDRNRRRDDKE
jgi:hypothetical protein